jgi:phage gpG-like protein
VSSSPRTTVDGAETVAITLGEAGQDLAQLAPPEVGTLIQNRSRAAAPFVSGRLRASINATAEEGRVQVGSSLEYAHVIHNGWAAHNIAANPFLIPVAEDAESAWGPMYSTAAARVVRSDVRGA